jgi:hypothetical protein
MCINYTGTSVRTGPFKVRVTGFGSVIVMNVSRSCQLKKSISGQIKHKIFMILLLKTVEKNSTSKYRTTTG